VVKVEAIYAFVFLIFIKILLPTYLAAKLNEKAHHGMRILNGWDSSLGASDFKYKLLVVNDCLSGLVPLWPNSLMRNIPTTLARQR